MLIALCMMAGAAIGLLYVIYAKVSQIVVLLRRIAEREKQE